MESNCELCSDGVKPGESVYVEQTTWILQDDPVTLPNFTGGHDVIPVSKSVLLPTGRVAHRSCVDIAKAGGRPSEVKGQEPLFS